MLKFIFATTYQKAFILGLKVPYNLYPTLPYTLPYPTRPYPTPTLYHLSESIYTWTKGTLYPTLPYPMPLPYTLPYPTLPYPYPTLPYPTLPYPTLPYPIPCPTRYPTLPYPTLPYPTLCPISLNRKHSYFD